MRRAQGRNLTFLLASLVLSLPSPVFARSQQADQRYSASGSASTERFVGDITYEFDSVFNRTIATYRAPLGKRDFFHRVFFPPPTVRRITASYEFPGRIPTLVPDSIRVVFESEEYIAVTSGSRLALATEHDITIGRGDDAVRHPLLLSRRIEVDSGPGRLANSVVFNPRGEPFIQLPQIKEVRVESRATASLSLCEFLWLTGQGDMRGTVAGLDFTLEPAVLAGLRVFAMEMLPNDADRRSTDCRKK